MLDIEKKIVPTKNDKIVNRLLDIQDLIIKENENDGVEFNKSMDMTLTKIQEAIHWRCEDLAHREVKKSQLIIKDQNGSN